MYRYVALIWDERDPDRTAAARRMVLALRGMASIEGAGGGSVRDGEPPAAAPPAVDRTGAGSGLALFHAGVRAGVNDAERLPGRAGAVFGTLFRSGAAGPRAALRESEHRAVIASGGDSLLESHWGRYVAIVRQAPGRTLILRDPTGGLPCLLAAHEGVWMAFSDVEDALAMGLRPSIDWPHIAALVRDFGLQTRETGLAQVTEVQPGESVELRGDTLIRRQRWEPLRIAARDPIEAPAAAAEALRRAVRQCVHAWASCHPRILHRLSGGLDSSIVLAALRDAPGPADVTCLNYFGEGPQEDERAYARRAAARAGYPLIEQPHEPEGVRLDAVLDVARTPRPYFYLYALEHGRFEARLAARLGATALFSGSGGDGLFYRNRAMLAAADCLRLYGLGRKLFRTALDAAIVERVSVWSVLGTALRRGVGRTLPGKTWQIRSIGPPLPYYDPLGGPDDPEAVQPLLSQPLIEVCLRIPTPMLVSGGWDRAIARRAFRYEIPPEIARRRAKGASTASAQRLFEANLPFLRDLLLDGVLVGKGLLDRAELERTMSPGASLLGTGFVPILLQHLATEAWLRRWMSL